jgi:hypothetical protein
MGFVDALKPIIFVSVQEQIREPNIEGAEEIWRKIRAVTEMPRNCAGEIVIGWNGFIDFEAAVRD